MSSHADPIRVHRRERWRGEWNRLQHGGFSNRQRLMVLLAGITVTGCFYLTWPNVFPRVAFVPFIVVGGLFLTPRALLVCFGYISCFLVVGLIIEEDHIQGLLAFLAVASVMGIMHWLSVSRSAVGLIGTTGDRMLIDLRKRQRALAQLPPLPAGWHGESTIAGAHGESFSGDFLLCSTGSDPARLECVLVDVSGKGIRAGTRSLMLSSALSGLLGQAPPDRFLEAANSYLIKEQWREGFATALHVVLDFTTGHFAIDSAGHPPAIHYSAATGRWDPVLSRPGPVLGVMDGMTFPQTSRRLDHGDALLLYTDGLIETRTNQLADGIDWMLGAIERHGFEGFSGVPAALVGDAQGGTGDDRAVVLIWRT